MIRMQRGAAGNKSGMNMLHKTPAMPLNLLGEAKNSVFIVSREGAEGSVSSDMLPSLCRPIDVARGF